jgi:hypothetical protein
LDNLVLLSHCSFDSSLNDTLKIALHDEQFDGLSVCISWDVAGGLFNLASQQGQRLGGFCLRCSMRAVSTMPGLGQLRCFN